MILYNGIFPKIGSSLKNHCSLSGQEFNDNFGYSRTCYTQALNRAMVGKKYKDYIWHDPCPTSREIVEGKPYNSATYLLKNGLEIEPKSGSVKIC